MSNKILFRMIESESIFLDPRQGFQQTAERFQVRFDPLTGRTGHFSHFGAIKPQKLDLAKYEDPQVKGFCPFCQEMKDRTTPKFVPDVLPEGRLARGEALLIPNLYPYDMYSAVTIMTDNHVVPLDQFSEQRLLDAFSAGIDFLRRVRSINPSLPYHIMAWNYMPPSGGGLVHPHQQYFATEHPGNQFNDEFKSARLFYANYQTDYWSELIHEEKKNSQRYIDQIGSSHWLASFVSLGILGEIMSVFPSVFCIDDFTEKNISDLVAGIRKVFCSYINSGIYSFNASLFFGPAGQRFFPAHFRIVPRTFLNTRDFAPDLNFFQAVLQEPVSVVMPEDLARDIKKYFK